MGFCRRCGDIVTGARCNKCGGFSVAPVVKWSQGDDDSKQDRWSRTYVTRDKSPTQEPSTNTTSTTAPLRPHSAGANRFPKPANHSQAPQTRLGARVSAHITAATASRPASPLKHSTSASEDSNAEEGILPNLHHSSELAKVYGSVLQPKESLESYHCALCSTVFSPDATIYPDPSTLSSSGESLTGGMGNRFLCRPCFVANGGSKGECPGCYRPVLILKAEGGFVEAAGSVWHRRCFNCDGCLKNIGDHPMVDLLGRPSCADCFETCLKRPPRDGNTPASPTGKSDPKSNLGGMKRNNNQSREGSPALQELELRLGILRSREGTPAREETVGRLNMDSFSPKNYDTQDSPVTRHRSSFSRETSPKVERRSGPVASILDRYRSPEPDSSDTDAGSPRPRRYSYSRLKSDLESSDDSPVRRRLFETESKPSSPRATGSPRHGSPKPTEAAIEEMKRRFLNQASSSPKSTAPLDLSSERTTPVRRRRSKSRSRSRPRFSDPPTESESTHTTPRNTPVRPALKSWSSTSSLRSALKSQNTGETDFSRIQSQRTGESALPLVRSQRTGDTEFTLERDYTGTTSYISSQRTGETVYDAQPVRRQKTGETLYNPQPVRRQKTGESAYTSQTIRRQKTGDTMYEPQPVRRQKTGDAMYEPQPVRRQKTGDTSYDPQPIRRQKTGDRDYVRRQRTGETVYPQSTGQTEYVRRQRTGDRGVRTQNTGETALSLRAQRTGETEIQSHRTGGTDYTLRRDRTGDAEVESLLGDLPVQEPVNLIDVSIPSSESSGSMSRIPVPVRRSDLSGIASLRTSSSTSSLRRSYEPATPDLSDFSDTMSIQSSGPSTPPSVSPPSKKSRSSLTKTSDITPTSKSKRSIGGISIPDPLPANTRCAKCKGPLFNTKHGGKFVTVPVEPTSTGLPPKTYHTACFTCNVCGEVFEEKEGGHAVFVRGEEGACHVRCAPPEKITLRKVPITPSTALPTQSHTPSRSVPTIQTTAKYPTSSSRYDRPPPTAPPTAANFTFPSNRFSNTTVCPECNVAVAVMERGVVPGPQGSRWHASCLICGGKEAKGKRKEVGKPGCGKKLDSAAKTDAEGRVWCRECLLLLPMELRQANPARSPPIQTTGTGTSRGPFVPSQSTGTTTLARQFTGINGGDPSVLRQLTGGGLSPTRQLSSSPTKMFDGPRPGAARYPRPKSVTGIRNVGGEGRGMFLVRQLTGGNTSFSGNDYGL